MDWLKRIRPSGPASSNNNKSSAVPEGLWKKCPKCAAPLYRPELERNQDVCPKCDHHMRIGARRRLDLFLDEQGRQEIGADIVAIDRLRFKDVKKYKDRLTDAQKKTGEKDALVAMSGSLHSMPIVSCAFEFAFHGGSMGYAVGEKFTRAATLALEQKVPFICFAATGGARMQEALISLMQMAKTSAKLAQLANNKLPYVSLCTDPTTGGTTASFAMLGDINISEPGALIAFAGPRVVKDTTGKDLPEGFQTSEFLLEHGFLDFITSRTELKKKINLYFDLILNRPLRSI